MKSMKSLKNIMKEELKNEHYSVNAWSFLVAYLQKL